PAEITPLKIVALAVIYPLAVAVAGVLPASLARMGSESERWGIAVASSWLAPLVLFARQGSLLSAASAIVLVAMIERAFPFGESGNLRFSPSFAAALTIQAGVLAAATRRMLPAIVCAMFAAALVLRSARRAGLAGVRIPLVPLMIIAAFTTGGGLRGYLQRAS